jgi:hypothetical protein
VDKMVVFAKIFRRIPESMTNVSWWILVVAVIVAVFALIVISSVLYKVKLKFSEIQKLLTFCVLCCIIVWIFQAGKPSCFKRIEEAGMVIIVWLYF